MGSGRKAGGAAVLGALAAVGVTAAAIATTPELGAYDWRSSDGAVRFMVVGAEEPRIEDADALDAKCGRRGRLIEITKPIEVSATGRFSFDGPAAVVGGGRKRVEFAGRFERSTKAEGRVEIQGCDGKVRFKARRLGGP